ncbi:MAG TPA: DUF721 domain-containing protein [Eggerthellaceae bacterium]|nr:DUF721 domain-containing protein [Eggerthellaceae bacterium]
MHKIGAGVDKLIASLSGDSEQARIMYRTHQVRERYRQALNVVYGDLAELFLAHTNNVYIVKRGDLPTLIVYVDESIFAAELNAQRELIRLKFLELFGEDIARFDIHVSRGKYKNNHPYAYEGQEIEERKDEAPALSKEEESFVESTVSPIEDARLRESLEKAMKADIKRTKAGD